MKENRRALAQYNRWCLLNIFSLVLAILVRSKSIIGVHSAIFTTGNLTDIPPVGTGVKKGKLEGLIRSFR